MKEKSQKINLMRRALLFKKSSEDIWYKLSNPEDDCMLRQINDVLATNNPQEIETLATFMTAIISWSSRRCKLLGYLLTPEDMAKLENAGFKNANKKLDLVRADAYKKITDIEKEAAEKKANYKRNLSGIMSKALELISMAREF